MAACPSVDCSKHRLSLEKRNEELHKKIRSLQTELRKREALHRKSEVRKGAAERSTGRVRIMGLSSRENLIPNMLIDLARKAPARPNR